MTLDEAIAQERELAEENYMQGMLCHANPNDDELDGYVERGKYHEHLAEWLEDLKRRRKYDDELMGSGALKNAYKSGYNKAINDFADELKHSLLNNYRHFLRMDSDGFEWLTTDAVETHIDETLKKFIVK